MAQDLGSLEKVLRLGEGRRLKRLQAQAEYVASLEPDFEHLSDEELAAKTVEFKQRYENGETLEELLFEAYAAVREAAKRALGQRPFDVQVMGGTVLREGHRARAQLRDGGGGRRRPERRGADAADPLRRAGDRRQDLLRLRQGREVAQRRPARPVAEGRAPRRGLRVRREAQDDRADAVRC